MTELNTSKYILDELKGPFTAEDLKRYESFGKRILWLDKNNVPGAFQMNCSWYLKALPKGPPAHSHDCAEIIGFISGDPDNPYDLGGEVEMFLEGERHLITKSTLLYVPPGMNHCPLNLLRVDRPIFHFTTVTVGEYITDPPRDARYGQPPYDKYFVSKLIEPESRKHLAPFYNTYARRILWLDSDVVPGAHNLNASWYCKASRTIDDKPHTHEHDEIIGFCGGDPNNPSDLNGEVEISLAGEKHLITKSSMIFVPAGMVHCPLTLNRVDRPIFHFTVVTGPKYVKNEKV